jgi:hypothetical protein
LDVVGVDVVGPSEHRDVTERHDSMVRERPDQDRSTDAPGAAPQSHTRAMCPSWW